MADTLIASPQIALGILVCGLATILVQVLSIPILLQVMGESGFAAFQICLSLLPWFSLAAFGMDKTFKNALISLPVESHAALKAAVSGDVTRRFVLLASCLAIASPWLPVLLPDAVTSLLTWYEFLAFILAMAWLGILGIAREGLIAENRGVQACWLQTGAMAGILACLLVILYFHQRAPDASLPLPAILAVWIAPQVLAWTIASRLLGLSFPSRPPASPLAIPAAAPFAIANAVSLIALNLDFIVLSWFSDTRTIVEYALVSKIVTVYAMFFSGVLNIVWVSWARLTGSLVRSTAGRIWLVALGLSAAVALATAGLIEPLAAWLGIANFVLPFQTCVALWLVLLTRSAGESLATLQFAHGQTHTYSLAAVAQAGTTLAIQYAAARYGFGTVGILFGTAAGWLILALILQCRIVQDPRYSSIGTP